MPEIENTGDTVRINKFIAHATGLSRREADAAIESGRVLIDGQVAILGASLTPTSSVMLDDKLISAQDNYTYVMLNKPINYVCSRKKQDDTPTIYDLLPAEHKALKAVGRLDKDSSGLILLTNDGDFALTMTHPRYKKQKIYEVTLDKMLQPLHHQMLVDHGVTLEDGVSQFSIESLDAENSYRITMSEGRNRQIRRTFAALGYTVTVLHRTQFGAYGLNDLAVGAFALTSKL